MAKKVLSIDGGGMYGVIALEVCIAIEAAMDKQLKDIFDLFVGTSTGSLIVASAVAGLGGDDPFGLSATTIMEQYRDFGKTIFSAKKPNITIPGIDVTKYPKYDAQALRIALNKAIGEKRMGTYSKDISISTYNMTKAKPHFFRSWVDSEPKINKDVFLRDAVRASSSAPTYHPMVKVDDCYYTDGGIFAGNPAYFALGQALERYPGEDLIVVSLGTGLRNLQPNPDTPDETVIWWAKNITSVLLDGQNESTDDAMKQIAGKSDWLDYFRFEVNLPSGENDPPKRADELDFDGTLKKARDLMRGKLSSSDKSKFDNMIKKLKQ